MQTEINNTIQPEILRPDYDILYYSVRPDLLEKYELNDLPQGIGVVGGAARTIAWEQLFNETRSVIRDIDLVGFTECNPDTTRYEKLSQKYMPDDFEYGNGVRGESINTYFSTRDFTINEVAIVEGRLLLTQRAHDDLRDKTIRFAEHEVWQDGSVSDRLYRKAELMECVFQTQFGEGKFVREGIYPYNPSPFHAALALNKAFELGEEVTARYLGCMAEFPHNNPSAFQHFVITTAIELLDQTDFEFRGSPLADAVNRRQEDRFWQDVCVDTYDVGTERAIELMNQYNGKLPAEASGY